MDVDEIAAAMKIDKYLAKRIIQKINKKRRKEGLVAITGKISQKFFTEKFLEG